MKRKVGILLCIDSCGGITRCKKEEGMMKSFKPVIYLYPEETTEVSSSWIMTES